MIRSSMLRVGFGIAAALAFAPASAQYLVPPELSESQAKNQAIAQTFVPTGVANDETGFAVATSERFALVGAPTERPNTTGGPAVGVVYVYARINGTQPWKFRQKLDAGSDDPNPGADRFGASLALWENVLLVGAPDDADDSSGARAGSVYVYVFDPARGSFDFRGKLRAAGAGLSQAGAAFGAALDLVGPQLLIGAPGFDGSAGTDSGAAAIFTCTRVFVPVPGVNCGFRTLLNPSDPRAGAAFGRAVAIVQPPNAALATALVGAPTQCASPTGCPVGVTGQGAAYAFAGSPTVAWTQFQRLTAPDAAPGDGFGTSVALNERGVLIGAPGDNGRGTVRAFRRVLPTWTQVDVLTPPPGSTEPMQFGASISLFRKFAAIGAPARGDVNLQPIGAAFLFEFTDQQWIRRDEITVGGLAGARFGASVALAAGGLIVGQPDGPSPPTTTPGRAYAFVLGRANNTQVRNPSTAAPASDTYGTAVAISGNVMAVGIPTREMGATASVGAVQMYTRAGPRQAWLPGQVLLAPVADQIANARFGHAVSLTRNGAHVLVGAPGARVGSAPNQIAAGAVFVFERAVSGNNWLPAVQHKLSRNTPAAGDDFGASLDISPGGTLLIVGAPQANGEVGAVTVFRNPSTVFAGKVMLGKFGSGDDVPPPGGIGDKWGSSVATDGEQAVAGAPQNGGGGGGDGYATVIGDSGGSWDNEDMMSPPADAMPGDEQDFGSSVDIDGGMIAVGAPGTDMSDAEDGAANADEGAIYAWMLDNNGQAQGGSQVPAPGGAPGDKWGTAVAVDDGAIGSGGPGVDIEGDAANVPDQGAVDMYDCYVNDAGLVVCELTDSMFGKSADAGGGTGSSVDMDDGSFAAGAPYYGSDEGAIYVADELFPRHGIFRDGLEDQF